MDILEKVRSLIEEDLKEINIFIDNIEYVKEDGNNFLRITIDKNGTIDIDDCVLASKIINPILDSNDIIPDSYILDVTSKERGEK